MNLKFYILCGFSCLMLNSVVWGNEPLYSNNACISCHQDLPGKLSSVVQEWKESIHFQNNVACDNCHGGDPSVKRNQFVDDKAFKERAHLQRDREFFLIQPSKDPFTSTVRGRNVSYYCGKCHSTIKEKHLGSPHGDLGLPTCLYCHGMGSHAIQKASVDIIDTRPRTEGGRCAACHNAATMEAVANIRGILTNAEIQLKNAAELYDWLEYHGYKNLELGKMYHHSRETLSQLRQTFHSFNMREINESASSIKTNAEITQDTYNMIKSFETAKTNQATIGLFAIFFLLCSAGLLLIYRKIYLHS